MKKLWVVVPILLACVLLVGGCAQTQQKTDAEKEAERIQNLEGNQEKYDFSHIEKMKNSPFEKKNLFVLGSSVAYGAASMQQAVGEYLASRLGMNLTKEAVSGTTLVDNGADSYVSRLKKDEYKNQKYDMFICQLSTNDATKKLPLGAISSGTTLDSFDTSTITGAIEYIVCYAKQTWNAPVYFFTGSYYNSPEYDAMVIRLNELSQKWGFKVLNLWSDKNYNNISDTDRKLYMSDDIHPTKAGYKDWWGPELEKQLLAYNN